MIKLNGISASEGLVIGRVHILDKRALNVKKKVVPESAVDNEINRLDNAITETEKYMISVKELSAEDLKQSHQFIFDVYIMLLKDDMFTGEIKRYIQENRVNAEYAVNMVAGKLIKHFSSARDEYLKERKNDIEHISAKIIKYLVDESFEYISNVGTDTIVVAHDLSPYEAAHLFKKNIKGFATDLGSKISHTSIIARAMGIPAVVGIENATYSVSEGDILILDGFEGTVIVDPDEDTLTDYYQREKRYISYVEQLNKLKNEDVSTKDGIDVSLFANVEINEEINISNEYRSKGVGLYRTEFLYLEKGDISEDEQFEILKEAIDISNGKPVVIRTFDLGGEKLSNILPHPDESNPVMGLRAIRYSLRFYDFFKKQIRAILRVSVLGNVSIMFPMISGIEEIDQAKKIVKDCMDELELEGVDFDKNVKIGIMVELPSIALVSDLAAKEVDFFSVGTNDLIQYTLGIDRNNEYVAYLYRPTHPGVLKLLRQVIESASKNGIDATVCGEMAGDPFYIPVLIGLGYRNLSMSPALLLKAKMIIRWLDTKQCENLVKELEMCKYARIAEEKLKDFINVHGSDGGLN